jgi:hypothetical protein
MKVLGLTIGRLFAALVFGLLIAFTITYITVPHPVEVPVQVITPIPTPPPVVITEHPVGVVHKVYPSATMSEAWNKSISGIDESIFVAFNLVPIMLVIVAVVMIITMMGGMFGGRDR